jgi:RNA polymerase sigma-70 factor (ECF subfamily)
VPDSDTFPSDGEVIAAVLSGQTERFADLARRYQPALLRVANSRLARRDWAEDVVQETFLCAFKSLHSYDSRYSFRTWLWTILLNQCRRLHQKQSRRPQVSTWTDHSLDERAVSRHMSLESSEAEPPVQLLAKERTERLESLLAKLPESQADALRLRFFGQLTFPEIAAAMGCSLSSAKNRVRWGLTKLSQLIDPRADATALHREHPASKIGNAPEQNHEL